MPRPTRDEAAQLDDLALGLLDVIPAETRRFAAAALCECDAAPRGLVRRLAEESVEIGAPLLVRSRALSDVDLIALIARQGVPHARAIARRDELNPVVAALIRALLARAETDPPPAAAATPPEEAGNALEAVRGQLRILMQDGAGEEEEGSAPLSSTPADPYPAIREAALSGETRRFAEALAAALGLTVARARSLIDGVTYSDLLFALRALELSPEQAFVLAAAAYPAQVTNPAAIRLFHVRYEALPAAAALEKVQAWRQQDRSDRATAAQSLTRVK
ncbi:hypothetical protein [Chelativorans sp.]|uniref:hypothetical protein n=1 Tax=Chelativorans sp. TaxID=2203393 RepID=UPI00281260DB|nr:hypothetical protein [Chelativorans sp.]